MGIIYSILNKSNGKIYVGQSVQGKTRFSQHKNELNNNTHFNMHLQFAWNKYGKDSFEFNVLEYCDDEKLNDGEDWWIDYFDSMNRDKGYNLRTGGDSNYKLSDEVKNKISNSMKNIPNPMHNPIICKKLAEKQCILRNNTGYYRVSKRNKSDCKQGFYWTYQWREDGKRRSINSTDLKKLEEKVISQGLEWRKLEMIPDGGICID